MNRWIKKWLLLLALVVALGSTLAGQVSAQTLTTFFNVSGANPDGLVLSGSTLYGKAGFGGGTDNGTVFKLNTDGTDYTVLHSFTATPPSPEPATNSDGAGPSGLFVSGNILYGTARSAGGSGGGTVFKMNTTGTDFTILYSFTPAPEASGSGSPPTNNGCQGAG